MRQPVIMVVSRKKLILVVLITFFLLFVMVCSFHSNILVKRTTVDLRKPLIVLDPGHGGIDGGANKDGFLEKDINLEITKRLENLLEEKGYKVVMTREKDISLDHLDQSSSSRHRRDLNARVQIINRSQPKFFLSIHVNCNFNKPNTSGSIVFYSEKYNESRLLATNIQEALNKVVVNGMNRRAHQPQESQFYILIHSNVPGVIIETAFLSNPEERRLLETDKFLDDLVMAIVLGVTDYLSEVDGSHKLL